MSPQPVNPVWRRKATSVQMVLRSSLEKNRKVQVVKGSRRWEMWGQLVSNLVWLSNGLNTWLKARYFPFSPSSHL